MELQGAKLLGVGLYTAADARTLTGVPLARIRRWLRGYAHGTGEDKTWTPPLWRPQLPELGGTLHIGFRDLIELRTVDAFRRAGLSLQQLRRAYEAAQQIVGEERPFSSARFRTDGKKLYLQVVRVSGEPDLIDLLTRQHNFNTVVEPTLKHLEYNEMEAVRWWPAAGRGLVVIDPKRAFGRPIVASTGVSTDAVADAYSLEQSYSRVAADFGMSEKEVRAAVGFERALAA